MDFTTKDLTHGQTNALIKNLMGQMGISDPIETVRRINAGEWEVAQVKLSASATWKRVTIGTLGNAKTTRRLLETAGVNISRWGGDILDRTTFKDSETILNLVRVSVKELGLKDGATTAEIYAAGERYGLSLCPSEVASQLWLSFPNLLQRGENSLLAMNPILDSSGNYRVFNLARYYEGRLLNSDYGFPNWTWRDKHLWVFARD